MVKETQIMQQEILKYILDHKVSFSGDIKKQDKLFNRVALDLFDYQFHNNLPFKRYAQSQRKTPLVIKKMARYTLNANSRIQATDVSNHKNL
ncbi:hypothetical protein [Secundilactobacillus collinoides]|uniref:hypothetical protein n=1 Tax=Secundilactobacillus collinoides TaxID=33960 RepID=UPI0006D13E67|nr:hypothetical protein [Secundilactobacillus collinoides]